MSGLWVGAATVLAAGTSAYEGHQNRKMARKTNALNELLAARKMQQKENEIKNQVAASKQQTEIQRGVRRQQANAGDAANNLSLRFKGIRTGAGSGRTGGGGGRESNSAGILG